MPHPESEHGLRVQLATALKERDEARALAEKWVRIEAAGVERGIRSDAAALSEFQQLQSVLANANGEIAHLTTLRQKLDAELVWTRKSLAAANARADATEAKLITVREMLATHVEEKLAAQEALAAARLESKLLRDALENLSAHLDFSEPLDAGDLGISDTSGINAAFSQALKAIAAPAAAAGEDSK